MSRRRFSLRQRVRLYVRSGGRCEDCGVELASGWHADHRHPWSQGGTTTVANGAALCPTCNLKKGSKVKPNVRPPDGWEPRNWQERTRSTFAPMKPGEHLTVDVTPGAGKTAGALYASVSAFGAGRVDRVIVTVPTARLRDQWHEEAKKWGLNLRVIGGGFDGALNRDAHGFILTSAALKTSAKAIRVYCQNNRVLVINDEVHHHSDIRTWGISAHEAFDPAVHVITLSGTLAREDGARIPFVRYKEDGTPWPHVSCLLGEAVAEGFCRKPVIHLWTGTGKWDEGDGLIQEVSLDEADPKDVSKVIGSLHRASSEYTYGLLEEADSMLDAIRRGGVDDAGGLVVCSTKRQARKVRRVLERITGEEVLLAVEEGDDEDGEDDSVSELAKIRKVQRVIADFSHKESRQKWIVSVRRISEGVDIPRVYVVVMLSSFKTETFFRQVLGRAIRRRGDWDVLPATLYAPDRPEFKEYAERVEEEMQQAALWEEDVDKPEKQESETLDRERNQTLFYDGYDPSVSNVIFEGLNIEKQIPLAKKILEHLGQPADQVHSLAAFLMRSGHEAPPAAPSAANSSRPVVTDIWMTENDALNKVLTSATGAVTRRRNQDERRFPDDFDPKKKEAMRAGAMKAWLTKEMYRRKGPRKTWAISDYKEMASYLRDVIADDSIRFTGSLAEESDLRYKRSGDA